MSQPELPEFLTKDDVATLARTTRQRVEYWDRRGWLPRIRLPHTRMVLHPRDEVLAWMRSNSGGAIASAQMAKP